MAPTSHATDLNPSDDLLSVIRQGIAQRGYFILSGKDLSELRNKTGQAGETGLDPDTGIRRFAHENGWRIDVVSNLIVFWPT